MKKGEEKEKKVGEKGGQRERKDGALVVNKNQNH